MTQGLGRSRGLRDVFCTFPIATPDRLSPQAAQRLIEVNFPHTRFLSSQSSASLVGRLSVSGISGGAVYDALVPAAAAEHGLMLVTRDARAVGTYRAPGVDLELLP